MTLGVAEPRSKEATMRIEEYEPGTPSWVGLSSPDVDASKRF